ncbi:MAG: hypothetical protein KIG88_12685, partial [Weeksellaceae bacterium]|nr:hypothetical protein [Weeksellaceae bacterium]
MTTKSTEHEQLNLVRNNINKTLILLRIGFLLISVGALIYFAFLTAVSFYIFNIYNWYFGVMLPCFLIILGFITSLLPIRYVLTLFQKISFGRNEITKKDEPELYDLVEEIKIELGLKRTPKLFLEQVDVILTEYSNQFDSLFRPSKINLIVGIYHFQSLTREELKSLIINELSKYNNENELDLIKFRNWEFSTSIKFY